MTTIDRLVSEAHRGWDDARCLALFLARRGRFGEAEDLFLAAWPKLPPWSRQSLRESPDAKLLLDREAVKAVVGEEGGS